MYLCLIRFNVAFGLKINRKYKKLKGCNSSFSNFIYFFFFFSVIFFSKQILIQTEHQNIRISKSKQIRLKEDICKTGNVWFRCEASSTIQLDEAVPQNHSNQTASKLHLHFHHYPHHQHHSFQYLHAFTIHVAKYNCRNQSSVGDPQVHQLALLP